MIGSGFTGSVYALKHPYNGHDAVIKVIKHRPGTKQHNAPPSIEAQNLHHVGQLLGHGHDKKTDNHYLVMKNMGQAEHHVVAPGTSLQHLHDEAEDRYRKVHHVENK